MLTNLLGVGLLLFGLLVFLLNLLKVGKECRYGDDINIHNEKLKKIRELLGRPKI